MSGTPPTSLANTPWTLRASADYATFYSHTATLPRPQKSIKKYKPVHRRYRPVPTYMPDLKSRMYQPIPQLPLTEIPTHPPPIDDLPFNSRMTRERLDYLMSKCEPGVLSDTEFRIMAFVLVANSDAFAFDYSEKGTFRRDCFPDYEYAVIEHTPWQRPPIPVPKAIEKDVRDELIKLTKLGKFVPSVASYRSALWTVAKKPGSKPPVRLVIAAEELNAVSIRDASLPPNINDFAESFAGHALFFSADMFSGFDARCTARDSQPLSTCHSLIGPLQQTTILQGYTNSLQEYGRSLDHTIVHLKAEDIVGNFIDDCAVKGPTSRYNGEKMPFNEDVTRCFWEFIVRVVRFLGAVRSAGITVSGLKTTPVCTLLQIVGSIMCLEGWRIGPQLVEKVLLWPIPISVSEVRMFLGLAGGGRRWIKGFAIIAWPLTALLSLSDADFAMTQEAEDAINELKTAMTTAPVLVRIDYVFAKLINPKPRTSDEGLIVLGVDSSWMGAGWVIYQIQDDVKKPALYGSSTFSRTQQNYGQPKTEVFGVFVALKAIRHRVWGVHFRLEHDASSLAKMLRRPDDVPNAPMLRWICWILLFDFETLHVPAKSFKMEDALSRAPHIDTGIPDAAFDAEEFLDAWEIGAAEFSVPRSDYRPRDLVPLLRRLRVIYSNPFPIISNFPAPRESASAAFVFDTPADLGRLSPSPDQPFSLLSHTLSIIRSYDPPIHRRDFTIRSSSACEVLQFSLGGEDVVLECFSSHSHVLPLSPPVSTRRSDDAGHKFGTRDQDDGDYWRELRVFLEHQRYPTHLSTEKQRLAFLRRSRRFALRDAKLFLLPKKDSSFAPRLVIETAARRQQLIFQVHITAGHRGRDPTYKLLRDRFYWPNMWDDVSWFVRSCLECQKAIQAKPILPYNESWTAPLLRHFDIDTIKMPAGVGDVHYLFHAIERTILWPEVRAVRSADSAAMAKFLYEDVICRYSCVPVITMDNGPEFQAEVSRLLETLYRCTVIFSTPYHPEGNAVVERHHQVLVNCLFKLTGDAKGHWPRYIHPVLFAIRVSVSRSTGYSPFYLLYGQHPVFSFDLEEHTWQTLDWHKVKTLEDLLVLRARQITRRDKASDEAVARLRESRRRAIEDLAKRHHFQFDFSDFEEGMYVWVRESRLDEIKGGKGEWTYAGPYIIHEKRGRDSFILRELSGNIMKAHINIRRLRLFYFRPENQTLRTAIRVPAQHDPLKANPLSLVSLSLEYRFVYGDFGDLY